MPENRIYLIQLCWFSSTSFFEPHFSSNIFEYHLFMKEGFFIQARSIANKAQECRDDDEEKSYYLSNSEKYKLLRTIFFEYHLFMKEEFFIQARSIANKAQECRGDDEEKKLLFV
jgi:hypothetical protein